VALVPRQSGDSKNPTKRRNQLQRKESYRYFFFLKKKDDSNWDPEDGFSQMLWKNKKHFQSVMFDGDLFEYPLNKMGEDSNLNGFALGTYQIFTDALDSVSFSLN
jgi:hypothetical protein